MSCTSGSRKKWGLQGGSTLDSMANEGLSGCLILEGGTLRRLGRARHVEVQHMQRSCGWTAGLGTVIKGEPGEGSAKSLGAL